MNINIGKTIVRKMANDKTQPERPLIHLIDSVFNEVESVGLSSEDVTDALHIAIDSYKVRSEDDVDEYFEKMDKLKLKKGRKNG